MYEPEDVETMSVTLPDPFDRGLRCLEPLEDDSLCHTVCFQDEYELATDQTSLDTNKDLPLNTNFTYRRQGTNEIYEFGVYESFRDDRGEEVKGLSKMAFKKADPTRESTPEDDVVKLSTYKKTLELSHSEEIYRTVIAGNVEASVLQKWDLVNSQFIGARFLILTERDNRWSVEMDLSSGTHLRSTNMDVLLDRDRHLFTDDQQRWLMRYV